MHRHLLPFGLLAALHTAGCNKDRCGDSVGFLDDTPPPSVCHYDDLRLTPGHAIVASASGLAPASIFDSDAGDAGARGDDAEVPVVSADAVSVLPMRVVATGPNGEFREGALVQIYATATPVTCPRLAQRDAGGDDAATASESAPLGGRLVSEGTQCKQRSYEWLTCSLGVDGSAPFHVEHSHLRFASDLHVIACSGNASSKSSTVQLLADPGMARISLSNVDQQISSSSLPSTEPICTTNTSGAFDCSVSTVLRTVNLSFQGPQYDGQKIALSIRAISGSPSDVFFAEKCDEGVGDPVSVIDVSLAQKTTGHIVTMCVNARGGRYILRADPIGFSAQSTETAFTQPSLATHILIDRTPTDAGSLYCARSLLCSGLPADPDVTWENSDGGRCILSEQPSELRVSLRNMDGGSGPSCSFPEGT